MCIILLLFPNLTFVMNYGTLNTLVALLITFTDEFRLMDIAHIVSVNL